MVSRPSRAYPAKRTHTPNFHDGIAGIPEREASRETSDVAGQRSEIRARRSRIAGATVRCSNAVVHDAGERALSPHRHPPPPRPFCPVSGNIESHGIKLSPGRVPSSFIRGRGGQQRFLRSVWRTGPFIPPNFQPHRVYGRPTSSQPSPSPLPPGGSRPPLGADTPGIHDQTPGAPGLPEYFIYSPPRFFLFAFLSRHVAPSSSPPLHLARSPSHLSVSLSLLSPKPPRLSIDALPSASVPPPTSPSLPIVRPFLPFIVLSPGRLPPLFILNRTNLSWLERLLRASLRSLSRPLSFSPSRFSHACRRAQYAHSLTQYTHQI